MSNLWMWEEAEKIERVERTSKYAKRWKSRDTLWRLQTVAQSICQSVQSYLVGWKIERCTHVGHISKWKRAVKFQSQFLNTLRSGAILEVELLKNYRRLWHKEHGNFRALSEVESSKKCTPPRREPNVDVKMKKTPHVHTVFGFQQLFSQKIQWTIHIVKN